MTIQPNMELLENITLLTQPNLDLHSITVLGLHLGMPKNQIPVALEREMPAAGWTHSNGTVTIRTSLEEPSTIVEFLLYTSVLEGLKVHTKKQVEELFGQATGIENRLDATLFFYEAQQLVVSWNNEKNQLGNIYIGLENRVQQTTYTIQDFLTKYYEFKAMVPHTQDWTAGKLQDNPPRFYRLKELEAFLRAFDLGEHLLDFANKKFLEKRSREDFTLILKDIEKYAFTRQGEEEYWEEEKEKLERRFPFRMLVQHFFNFSEQMRQLLQFNAGYWATGSIVARYSIHKTQKLLNSIDRTELEEIQALLGSILAPNNPTFTKSELIRTYGFPDVDLQTIDWDYY